jgi:hypothetical protein
MMLYFDQKVALVVSSTVAALLILLLAALAPRPALNISINRITPQFDAASAIDYTRVIAQAFPDRVTGTAGARRAAEYISAEFRKLGYDAENPEFSMWLAGRQVQGQNVVGRLPGETAETIAIIAHYDGQFTSHQAAEDNASGVGVLLELAQVLRQSPHRRGLIFIATDAEEWGMIGAQRLINFLKNHQTIAAISIDYLNAGPASSLEIDCSGQFGGYTPLWLREIIAAAGRVQGTQVYQRAGLWEWIERAIQVSAQDQGPLVHAGIPALNIATMTHQGEASRARYHTPEDAFRDFDLTSFNMLGGTVEQAVSTLDKIHLPAEGGMLDFRLSSGRFLAGLTIWFMQLLGILPVALAVIFAVRNLREREIDAAGWRALSPVSWIIPPCLAGLVLYGFGALNILKRYELYPATPKDPFLYHLPLGVIIPLLLILVGGWMVLVKVQSRVDLAPEPFAVRKQIFFLWNSLVAFAAFLDNPYAMWLFLGGFTYATLLLLPPTGILARVVNAMLLLAALLPFGAMLHSFGQEIFLGWRIIWYLVLQAAYHVWSPFAVAIFLLASLLWVQLFWFFVLKGLLREGVAAEAIAQKLAS